MDINNNQENLKNILSTALHDIYNEINNLFFISENLMENLQSPSNVTANQFRQDFFQIIDQIKYKQFLFNNLFNDKFITINEFLKYCPGKYNILGDLTIILPTKFIVILLLMMDKSFFVHDHEIQIYIKKKFLDDLINNNNKEWIVNFFKQYASDYQWTTMDQNLIINF